MTTTIKSNVPLTEEEIDKIEERIEKLNKMPESENVTRITKEYTSTHPFTNEEIEKLKEEFNKHSVYTEDDYKYTYTETKKIDNKDA